MAAADVPGLVSSARSRRQGTPASRTARSSPVRGPSSPASTCSSGSSTSSRWSPTWSPPPTARRRPRRRHHHDRRRHDPRPARHHRPPTASSSASSDRAAATPVPWPRSSRTLAALGPTSAPRWLARSAPLNDALTEVLGTAQATRQRAARRLPASASSVLEPIVDHRRAPRRRSPANGSSSSINYDGSGDNPLAQLLGAHPHRPAARARASRASRSTPRRRPW